MTRRFGTLFFRQVLRTWVRHPLLPVLEILCVAVGVTVFLAIQITNRGALESFRNAISLVAGRAHLEVRGDLAETLYPALAAVPGVKAATPLVEGIVTLPDRPGEYLRLLGVDPFTGEDLRVFRLEAADGGTLALDRWLRGPAVVAVPPGSPLGGPSRVVAAGVLREIDPAFVLVTDDAAARSDPRLAAMDIGWAQRFLDLKGRLTSVQILLEDPLRADEVVARLAALVPADVTVGPPARRGTETEQMLAAFQLNLTALSLVSIVVGVFLIYNSLSAAVVRRRVDIGILRACGASKAEISALFLGQGFVAGVIGSALGLLLAGPLAALLANPVGLTVSSLYTLVAIDRLALTPWQVVLAFGVGTGAALLAAWRPAREAAGCDPALVLRPGSAVESFVARSRGWTAAALVGVLAATLFSWASLAGGGSALGFVAVGCLVAGTALVAPALLFSAARIVRGPGWTLRLAAQHLGRAVHRNAVTVAALAIAAGMTVSVSVMIHSFRASVMAWSERTLVADLFIAPAANEIVGLQTFMPAAALEALRQDTDVAAVATFRELGVRVDGRTASLGVTDGAARGELEFLDGIPGAATAFHDPDRVAVSESYATRHGTRPGATLRIMTPAGERPFTVVGVIRDFTRDSGLILMDRATFSRHWADERVHSFAVKVREGVDAEAVAERFRRLFGAAGEFSIYTNAALRARVMEIFDQTFAVTSILRAVAVVIAIAGVFLSLTTLVVEREREIGVLRSVGASRTQIRNLVLAEAGLLGLLASVLGVASGAGMAMILTWVINKAFFGWSIALRYPLDVLAGTALWLVPAALVAAAIPALRAARIPPAQALRFE